MSGGQRSPLWAPCLNKFGNEIFMQVFLFQMCARTVFGWPYIYPATGSATLTLSVHMSASFLFPHLHLFTPMSLCFTQRQGSYSFCPGDLNDEVHITSFKKTKNNIAANHTSLLNDLNSCVTLCSYSRRVTPAGAELFPTHLCLIY